MFLDLATNPGFAKRTELTSGKLMTLTTNTKIWSNPQLLWMPFLHLFIIVFHFLNLMATWFTFNLIAMVSAHFMGMCVVFQFVFQFRCRSRKHQRFWTGKEMLASLGYPVRPRTANQLGTEPLLSTLFDLFILKVMNDSFILEFCAVVREFISVIHL